MSESSITKEYEKITALAVNNTNFITKQSFDVYALIIFNIIMFLIFSKIDFLEMVYNYSKEYEHIELDEIVPLFFTLTISLFLFSLKRLSELKKTYKITHEMSIKDHLTGLFNRRIIEDFYKIEVNRIKRSESDLTLLIIDIDNFKKINDKFGHNTGDLVLKEFSSILKKSTRKMDIISRWGGEEFLLLCPHSKETNNEIIANRILNDVREYSFSSDNSLSASIGMIKIKNKETFEDSIKRADDLLYKAKHAGKDCCFSD